jgi:carbamoyl-phosphate synthase large subunit
VPFVSKATGVPLARIATLVMMGAELAELRDAGRLPAVRAAVQHVAIKEAVLPWKRFPHEDRVLGPEMRATGEVMGIAETVGAAYAKALRAAGHVIPRSGTVFISLNDADKPDGVLPAQRLAALGYRLLATHGTAGHLARNGLEVTHVDKVGDGPWDPVALIESGHIDLVVNTPSGSRARSDGSLIRQAATRHDVPCVTTVRGGRLLAESLHAEGGLDRVASLQSHHAAAP